MKFKKGDIAYIKDEKTVAVVRAIAVVKNQALYELNSGWYSESQLAKEEEIYVYP